MAFPIGALAAANISMLVAGNNARAQREKEDINNRGRMFWDVHDFQKDIIKEVGSKKKFITVSDELLKNHPDIIEFL